MGLEGSHDLGRELPLSGLREELSVREEPHPRVMSADQLLYNKARRSQRASGPGPRAKRASRGEWVNRAGVLRLGEAGA